jgi:HupE / UreJ protein
MKHRQERARRRPGPLALIAALAVAVAVDVAIVRAHDPGLSSLDVTVTGSTISALLSIAPADVALLGSALPEVVRDAIQVSVGGEPLAVAEEELEGGPNGARVRFAFRSPESIDHALRLSVTSTLPRRLSRGHREVAVVTVNGHVLRERVLDGSNASLSVDLVVAPPSIARRAASFVTLGIAHILTGYDHLVFLAGLLLAAGTLRQLLVALTAFTAAHSISLALVAAGGVHAPPALVEPLIAASIAWVGVENLIGRRGGARWWIVFAFGLVHGFGFAGALLELGFGSSTRDVAVALVSFNSGVEIGQLAAAGTMLPMVYAIRSRPIWQTRVLPACSLLIVAAGSYWLIERLL